MKYAIPMLAATGVLAALLVAGPARSEEPPVTVTETVYYPELHQGKTIEWWARRTVQARKDANARGRTIKRLKRVLAHDPTVREAIALAARIYGVPESTLRRKAWCESKFNPRAKNRRSTAAGLLQFLDSTWASTPFEKFSVYSAYANALAAGWMHANGRGGEWECK